MAIATTKIDGPQPIGGSNAGVSRAAFDAMTDGTVRAEDLAVAGAVARPPADDLTARAHALHRSLEGAGAGLEALPPSLVEATANVING